MFFVTNSDKKFRRVSYSTKEGIAIWYLLACQEQEEENVLLLCKERLSQRALLDAFILTYDRMCRYKGAWHLEQKLLFPASVFLESENAQTLSRELMECVDLAKGRNCLIPLNLEEKDFLKSLCGDERHLRISRGIIRKGITKITEGPLMGLENRICKIDRHKRLAKIATTMRQNNHYITAGLEITEKIL